MTSSKLWRIQNLYKINSKYTGAHTFNFLPVQWEIYTELEKQDPKRYFILKSRQPGISTFFLLYWLDTTLFMPNNTTGILAHKWESLKSLFKIIRYAYDNIPEPKPKLGKETETSMSFPQLNSEIFVSLEIRSAALTNLHISEWCLCEDDRIKASLAAVGEKGHITGESTGFGVGNHGYNTYQDAKLGLNQYKCKFIPWWDNPYNVTPLNGIEKLELTKEEKALPVILKPEQILHRRYKKRELRELFSQEWAEDDETCFLSTGGTYFNNKKIHKLFLMAKKWLTQNKVYEQSDDYIAWEKPDKYSVYVSGVDVAEGGGVGDYSVIKILNRTYNREAFLYRARVGVDTLYRKADLFGRKFYNAQLAVERNNHGHAVLLGLREDSKYPNLYKDEGSVTQVFGLNQKEPKYGWLTSNQNKKLMLDTLKIAIEGDSEDDEHNFEPSILILDQVFLEECLTLIQENNKIGAIVGKHDDDVMASAIAYQMYMKIKNNNVGKINRIHGGGIGIFQGIPREITG